MKSFCVLLILMLGHNLRIVAQTNIGLNFNNIHIGNNCSFDVSHRFKKHTVAIGVSYLLNNKPDYDANFLFKNQGHARNTRERIGAQTAYTIDLLHIHPHVTFSAGYKLFYTYTGFRSLVFSPYSNLRVPGVDLYVKRDAYYTPAHTLQHNLLLQMRTQLTANIYIIKQAGGGFTSFFDMDKSLARGRPARWTGQMTENLCYFFSVGLQYDFQRK